MKIIYAILILSSTLMALQKQIILGSYLVEANAHTAVKAVEKQILNDKELNKMMQNNKLHVISRKIGDYTVVSVNVFASFSTLLPAIKTFKKYYGDTYTLSYPSKGYLQQQDRQVADIKENQEEVTKVVELENISAKEAIEEVKETKKAKAEDDLKKLEALVKHTNELEEVQEIPSVQKHVNVQKDKKKQEKVTPKEEVNESGSYYLIGVLSVLLLMIGGFLAYKKMKNKDN